jgi:hypothetical protein
MTVTVPKYAFKPSWKDIKEPSENKELEGTQAQRLFSPMAGVFVKNPYSGEDEVMIGGWEDRAASVKIYQAGPDKYSRAFLPESVTMTSTQHGHVLRNLHQGMGRTSEQVIVAGGTPYADQTSQAGCDPSSKIFTIDAKTKKVDALPDMPTGRAAGLVGASPDGRYLLVAGGVRRPNYNEWAQISDAIEVYDTKSREWIDVDSKFPGLSKMPASRFGGNAVWVKDEKMERLFLVGGSSGNAQGQFVGFEGSPPTQRVDVYDFKTCQWLATEIPTPRMYPGVDARKLPDGQVEVVVAGGGTGQPANVPVDPQLYAVERINPYSLDVSFGQHVPEQPAIKTGNHGARDWSANALVFATGFGSGKTACEKATDMAFFFGFSRAVKGALLEPEAGK